ncbi:hypothetical protein EDB83DRAFT_252390 [Lactarius deliciosus]|nr:hypothetical protein EDB83DRAFT_252390 [Lactarius deliciosus]
MATLDHTCAACATLPNGHIGHDTRFSAVSLRSSIVFHLCPRSLYSPYTIIVYCVLWLVLHVYSFGSRVSEASPIYPSFYLTSPAVSEVLRPISSVNIDLHIALAPIPALRSRAPSPNRPRTHLTSPSSSTSSPWVDTFILALNLTMVRQKSPTSKALQALVSKIPAKTLHAYVLAHLPTAPPATLTALASFFATLTPPTRLHCVRCHSDYIEVENDDRSCQVPHDGDSADIGGVGMVRYGDGYVTEYGCCGVTGDADDGPPDDWCYEGMHTVSHVTTPLPAT